MTNSKKRHTPSNPHDRMIIKKLYAENRRLNRELDLIKKELDALEGRRSKKSAVDRYHSNFEHGTSNEFLFSKKNYFSYIYSTIRRTSIFKIYKRIIDVIRRYTFITTSLKVISFIFVFIEASVILVVSTSAFIISLVITLLASHVLIIFTLFNKKKCDDRNKELIKNKNVTVLFPPKGRAFEYDSYFSGFVCDTASGNDNVSIIVSPYSISSQGLHHSHKKYYNSRSDGNNIILVRRHYYFSLRRNIIDPLAKSVTEIF
ncbi:MAG: hypothetical protein J6B72_05255 [Clostridia bacterium]|nr:hypothetical protein [Clostridia bacterium]